MDEATAANLFGVLSNADRLRVIRVLVEAGPDGRSAGEIAGAMGATPSRASFHLAALSEAGFAIGEKQSRQMIYRINFEHIGALIAFLMEDCCKGSTRLRACCGMA